MDMIVVDASGNFKMGSPPAYEVQSIAVTYFSEHPQALQLGQPVPANLGRS
ncbi:hypothetical protein [Roseateles violae]|uniref:Uncharacterized protein n=1 Tax=Roseateles violae TaxID=3058042 RepID=A0ABT8DQZ6_9BURK|nr:hypothetical protein [Pelomonas sp. PFR6]MDN3920757.1 hypothetical protein [Pelomonas sp. PFR6]